MLQNYYKVLKKCFIVSVLYCSPCNAFPLDRESQPYIQSLWLTFERRAKSLLWDFSLIYKLSAGPLVVSTGCDYRRDDYSSQYT